MRRPASAAEGMVLAAVMAAAFSTAGCKVDQVAFEARVFGCDTAAKDKGCGVDENGVPMICFPGSILDGTDFCTKTCGDTSMSLPAENAVCVQGNALLGYCDPSQPNGSPQGCNSSQLGCLRTDVTSNEGVCTTLTPCSEDKDCTDPVRSTCASTFLKQLYAGNDKLQADHLYCLQKNCKQGGSSCAPGQSCLPDLIPAAASPPDICVPNCDSLGHCPPNHFCYQAISGRANPAICIPGLLGFVCSGDIDCLVGKCVSDDDPGGGLSLCSVACASDDDCTPFDSPQGMFVCLPDPALPSDATFAKRCVTPNAYRGASCSTDADCTRDSGTICVYQSPTYKPTDLGTCLRPCDATGACQPRAQIGQTCLPFYDPSGKAVTACYPGFFGLPCATEKSCVGDLTCRTIPGVSFPLCSTVCQTDADCEHDRWTRGQAFCAGSVCVPLLADDAPCSDGSQCASKLCAPSGDMSGATTCQEAGS